MTTDELKELLARPRNQSNGWMVCPNVIRATRATRATRAKPCDRLALHAVFHRIVRCRAMRVIRANSCH